ncbi:hydroxymethylglutaryl-CoA lyase [Falsirhodobacter xinxiangensis]|uniref:hydroxymethylglutaryl-CoA lyase n=1 Tax=Falsirhodobacter xinxiangensis TaxID=2530049 RepID=UPI0010AB2C2D|nr:hydroxymethylglutaryl-CoA lyase [Rhodobacter xinxiangensis]
MSDLPKRVTINEDGPREGIQIEKTRVPTADKIALIDALSQTGLAEIQTVSFVSPKKVPQWNDAEDVVAGLTLRPGVRYTSLYLNARGLDRAIATGRLSIEGGISLSASSAFLSRNMDMTPERQRETRREMIALFKANNVPITKGSVNAAFGCNFQGDIPLDQLLATLEDVFALAAEADVTLETIGLSDTMGWATPGQVTRTVGTIRERYPNQSLSLHLHDTRGMAIANAQAGLEMGVSDFDTSVGGLGGCPFAAHKGAAGNLCTEDFVFLCEEAGIETGIDFNALIEASVLAERIVGHPLPGSVRKGGSLHTIRAGLGQ